MCAGFLIGGKEMIWGGLVHDAESVQDIINQTSSIYIGEDGKNTEFMDTRIQALEDLKAALLVSEQNFFFKLGYDNEHPKKNFQLFQKKLAQINKSNAAFKINNIESYFLEDPSIVSLLDTITSRAVGNALNKIDWTVKDFTGMETDDIIMSYFIKTFSDIIKTRGESGRFINYFVDSSDTTKINNKGEEEIFKRGLRRILKITRQPTTKNIFNIDIQEDAYIDSKTKNKLLEVIRGVTGVEAAKSTSEFRQLIIERFLNYVRTYADASGFSSFLEYELTKNIQSYDLYRNFSSLKGFLQEIWSNALLSYLFNSPGTSVPTGNIKNLLDGGHEIPVDAVLDLFNFQIKSWDLKDGKYEIRDTSKEIATFINNRAEISTSDALILFFATFQFNQPFTMSESVKWAKNNADMSIEDYENKIYSQFNSFFTDTGANSLQKVFQSHIDKIIRIDNVFKGDVGKLFEDKALYYNTFFIINDQFIPGSAMVQAIIDSLRTKKDSDILRFSITGVKNQPGINTLDSIIQRERTLAEKGKNIYKETRYYGDVEKVANLVRLSYTITINFQDILQLAYSNAVLH